MVTTPRCPDIGSMTRPSRLASLLRLGAVALTAILVLGGLALFQGRPSSATPNPAGWNIALAIGSDPSAGALNAGGFVFTPSTYKACNDCSFGIQTSVGGSPEFSFADQTTTPASNLGVGAPATTTDGMTYFARFDTPTWPAGRDGSMGQLFTPTASGQLGAQLQMACLLPSGGTPPPGASITLYQIDANGNLTDEVQQVPFPWAQCPTLSDWSSGLSSSAFQFVDTGLNASVVSGTQYVILLTGTGGTEPWDETTSISGTVTGSMSGAAVSGACVTATPTAGSPTMVTTNPDGTYYFYGLATGNYTVSVDPSCAGNVTTPYQSQTYPSPVSAPLGPFTFLNFSLSSTGGGGGGGGGGPGSISGTLTDSVTGNPVMGPCVTATTSGGSLTTGSMNGAYQFTNLPNGTYTISVDPTCNGTAQSNYAPQTYPSPITLSAAQPEATGVNFVLVQPISSLSGTVTVASTGLGIGGVCVTASKNNSPGPSTTATTSGDGTYTISGLSLGDYTVLVDPTCNNQNSSSLASQILPNPVVVTATPVTGVNVALAPGSSISGYVTDAVTGSPLSGVCVNAHTTGASPVGLNKGSASGPDGSYTVNDLTVGVAYQLTASPCNGQVYAPLTLANLVTVTTNPINSVNFALNVGGSISGTVVNGLTGLGVANACVGADEVGGFGAMTQTTASGTYAFTSGTFNSSLLNPGTYAVSVDPTCAQNQPSPFDTELLTNVVVTPGGNTVLPDFALGQATMTPTGTGIVQELVTSNGTVSVTFTSVSNGGTTDMTPLSPGDVGYTSPVGFALGASPTYVDVATTATYSGAITACFAYQPSNFPAGATPQLLHYTGGQWQDVTTSVNTTTDTICGSVTSLSPLALGLVTTPPTIANIPTGAVSTGGTLTPAVSTNGDGVTSVTSSTPGVCTVSGSTVAYVGIGTCTLTAHVAAGTVYAAADGVPQSFTVLSPVAITSAGTTTFTVGESGRFQMTATGSPAPTFSVTGPLPKGVGLSSAGLLSGKPAAGTGGSYVVTVTASNGAGNGTQSFTLVVDQSPMVTSCCAATFTVGQLGHVQMTATGYPAPTFSATGKLPLGVTLSSAGLLSGDPVTGTGGVYLVEVTAKNGVGPGASLPFVLLVVQAPAITSAGTTTFTLGQPSHFQMTATGYPSPVFRLTAGKLPAGVTLSSSGLLSGKPSAGTAGTYAVTVTASNGVGAGATQHFTLVVNR